MPRGSMCSGNRAKTNQPNQSRHNSPESCTNRRQQVFRVAGRISASRSPESAPPVSMSRPAAALQATGNESNEEMTTLR